MNIVLTNDDGIHAPGLAALYQGLSPLGNVTVVAPHTCCSGKSHSITYRKKVHCRPVRVGQVFTGYAVNGTPADCVKLAYHQLHLEPIDLLVSGINAGANIGTNIFYSGTVAAAIEAAALDIPAIAASMVIDTPMAYERSAEWIVLAIKQLQPMDPGLLLNINVPRLSDGPTKGFRVARQSTRGFEESMVPHRTLSRGTAFQLVGGQPIEDAEDSDTELLFQGYITITPLRVNLTDDSEIDALSRQLRESGLSFRTGLVAGS